MSSANSFLGVTEKFIKFSDFLYFNNSYFIFIFTNFYFLDICTTLIGLQRGYFEGNATMNMLLSHGLLYFMFIPYLIKLSIIIVFRWIKMNEISSAFSLLFAFIHLAAAATNIFILIRWI